MRVQQGTAFFTVLFKYDITGWPTVFYYRGKWSALFCCGGRIEIKHALWCLLPTNILGVEMLFEIQNPWLYYFKQHFSTLEFFCNKHNNACFISETVTFILTLEYLIIAITLLNFLSLHHLVKHRVIITNSNLWHPSILIMHI